MPLTLCHKAWANSIIKPSHTNGQLCKRQPTLRHSFPVNKKWWYFLPTGWALWILPYIHSYSHINTYTFSHTQNEYEPISYCTCWHTETHKSIKVVQTKAHLNKMTPSSKKKPMKRTSRDDWPFNSALPGMFYVQDVTCPVNWWATTAEPLSLRQFENAFKTLLKHLG